MPSRLGALGCLLATVSCTHPAATGGAKPIAEGASLAASVPLRPEPPGGREGEAGADARVVALHFDLNGRAFPLPLVHGTVGGEPVWMLVDTGANSHVIAAWVARKIGMPLRPLGGVGSDHAGRAVNAYAALRPQVTIDGWGAVDAGPILVTDVPEAIGGMGIGAFVSPQALARPGEAVILDLAHHELRTAPWADAVRSLDARGGVPIAGGGAHICRDDTSLIRGLAFVIPAEIDGRKVSLLLDTGAHHTDLLTPSRAANALASRSVASKEPMYAASGLVKTRVVHGARVKLGRWTVTTDVDLVAGTADRSCPRDGALSMDALSGCTLLLGRSAVLGRCGP